MVLNLGNNITTSNNFFFNNTYIYMMMIITIITRTIATGIADTTAIATTDTDY